MTKDDEEVEIIPHLKGSTDFEVYEQVEIKPLLTVLPWDDNVKPNYTLTYKVRENTVKLKSKMHVLWILKMCSVYF